MRTIKVWGERDFVLEVSDDSKITFGPFSPPGSKGWSGGSARGTLRVYQGKTATSVIAVFAGVDGFRDMGLRYEEEPREVQQVHLSWAELTPEERDELAEFVARKFIERAAAEPEELEVEPLPF